MVLDTTVGGPSANSYLSVAEADAFAAGDVGDHGQAWLAATLSDKESALMTATDYIDAGRPWLAQRWSADQARVFPRAIDVAADTALPYLESHVRRACYEQAVYLLVNGRLIDQAIARNARDLVTFQDDDGSGSVPANTMRKLLAPKALLFLNAVSSGSRARGPRLVSVPIGTTL